VCFVVWGGSGVVLFFFFFNDTATTEIYTLSLHDALPISSSEAGGLTIRIDRARAGRKVRKGHKIVCKVTRGHVKRGRCTAYTKTATLTRTIEAGRVSVNLTGRIGRRKMAAAPYRLTLTLRDDAGNVSKPSRLRFTIIPG